MSNKNEIKQLKQHSFKRSLCPVSCALDVIGDKWTLLIVRDLIRGRHRYGELLSSKEGITTNILAERLRRLEGAGLVEKRPYQDRPVRYEYYLTGTGQSLESVIWAIVDWANEQIPGTTRPKRN